MAEAVARGIGPNAGIVAPEPEPPLSVTAGDSAGVATEE